METQTNKTGKYQADRHKVDIDKRAQANVQAVSASQLAEQESHYESESDND